MSPLWVLVEDLAEPGRRSLAPDEVRHVVSRRLREGDELVVFDAQGGTASARIVSLSRREIEVEVARVERVAAPGSGFSLATAIPKGDRLSSLLQMWTQLGLECWQPLVLEESAVRKLDPESARIQRILIEACKVARRPWSMQILPPRRLDEAIAQTDPGTSLYFGDREGRAHLSGTGPARVFIGPEAGFSDLERRRLEEAGASAISFGDYNLRIETAAVAAMVAFNLGEGAAS